MKKFALYSAVALSLGLSSTSVFASGDSIELDPISVDGDGGGGGGGIDDLDGCGFACEGDGDGGHDTSEDSSGDREQIITFTDPQTGIRISIRPPSKMTLRASCGPHATQSSLSRFASFFINRSVRIDSGQIVTLNFDDGSARMVRTRSLSTLGWDINAVFGACNPNR